MTRRLIIVTFAWLLCLYLPTASAAGIAADSDSQARGVLFRIQDAQHTLYLFGTIHVGADNFYPLAPPVMQALIQAPAIALEIDQHNIPAIQTAVRQYGLYPVGKTYLTELPAPLLPPLGGSNGKIPPCIERLRALPPVDTRQSADNERM